jgi:hypothetical protein
MGCTLALLIFASFVFQRRGKLRFAGVSSVRNQKVSYRPV